MRGALVITKKSAIMQRLADLVRTGHRMYVCGELPVQKVEAFAAKMDRLYSVYQHPRTASRRRAAGRASFRLLLYAGEASGPIHWWLLRTEGEAPPEAERERWRDAMEREGRVTLTGYELVRHTRAGVAHPSWTWRYTREQVADLRHAIIRAIRTRRDDELRQLIHTISRTPGFAGARVQVKAMLALVRGEWKRSRPGETLPELPKIVWYAQRVKDVGVPVEEIASAKKLPQRRKSSAVCYTCITSSEGSSEGAEHACHTTSRRD